MSDEATSVVSLEDFRAAKANGGWRVAQIRCVACGHQMVAVGPCGSPLPSCSRCNGACARELAAITSADGTPDPQEKHRRFLVGLLEDTLAAVVAGHVDGAFLVTHQSDAHPDGCAWAAAFSGNIDPVHQLGALELAKADHPKGWVMNMLTDVPFTSPAMTDREREDLRAAIGEFSAPLRLSRGLRFYVADAMLFVGDMLVIAGHALGAASERIDPHP